MQRGNARHRGVDGLDDFRDAPDVRLRVGEQDGVAAFIRADRRVVGEQRAQVLDELGGFAKTQRQDLRDHLVLARDVLRLPALMHRQVALLRAVAFHDFQNAPVADGHVAFLDEHGVQQIHRVLRGDRLAADHIHRAAHRRFLHDDKARRLAQIIQHIGQRSALEVQHDGALRRDRCGLGLGSGRGDLRADGREFFLGKRGVEFRQRDIRGDRRGQRRTKRRGRGGRRVAVAVAASALSLRVRKDGREQRDGEEEWERGVRAGGFHLFISFSRRSIMRRRTSLLSLEAAGAAAPGAAGSAGGAPGAGTAAAGSAAGTSEGAPSICS